MSNVTEVKCPTVFLYMCEVRFCLQKQKFGLSCKEIGLLRTFCSACEKIDLLRTFCPVYYETASRRTGILKISNKKMDVSKEIWRVDTYTHSLHTTILFYKLWPYRLNFLFFIINKTFSAIYMNIQWGNYKFQLVLVINTREVCSIISLYEIWEINSIL